jgi:hypothetical protein
LEILKLPRKTLGSKKRQAALKLSQREAQKKILSMEAKVKAMEAAQLNAVDRHLF